MKTIVITINYNNPDDTYKCLQSLAEYAPSMPVVVVDNASTVGNIDETCSMFDSVKLIKNESNLGFGPGNNVGIKWALENTDKEYVLLLNNDAFVDKDTISLIEKYMDDNPHIDGSSTKIVFAKDPDRIWFGGGEINWKKGGCSFWNIQKNYKEIKAPVEVTFITGCIMMLRRSVFDKYGFFDPRYFIYVEDSEYCARITSKGGRLAYVPNAVVYHNVHGSIKKDGKEFNRYESLNNPRLAFVYENAVCNKLLALNTYAKGTDKIIGNTYLFLKWFKFIVTYLLHGRIDVVLAMARGFKQYFKLRK